MMLEKEKAYHGFGKVIITIDSENELDLISKALGEVPADHKLAYRLYLELGVMKELDPKCRRIVGIA